MKEKDIIVWNGVSGPVKGYVLDEGEGLRIYTDDRHCFSLDDIVPEGRENSAKVIGTVKFK